MISCEVSLYPMDSSNSDQIINSSVDSVKNLGLTCNKGILSTFITGSDDKIWQGLKNMFDNAQKNGKEIAMVVTLANSKR